MAACNGYYYATRDPLGGRGDFTTAPEISQMFGEMVGAALADSWKRANSPTDPIYVELGPGRGTLAADALLVSLVEGWRGQICHVAITDRNGQFACYKVVDPSFHNWIGLMMALRDQQISDFPLCNKSFNLSYCGHDL